MRSSRDRGRRLRSARGRVVVAAAVVGAAIAAVFLALGGAVVAVAYVAMLPARRLAGSRLRRAGDWRPVRAARALSSFIVMGVLLTAGASAALAHLDGNANSTVDTATPISLGTSYSGQFVGADDVDHYAFTTTKSGVVVRVTVANTFGACPKGYVCPIWGTLVDSAGRQLGGEGSGAGTGPVNARDAESFNWTLGGPARYVLAMDSDGDQPSYQIRIDELPSGSGGGSSPNLFGSLGAARKQRGTVVRGSLAGVRAGATVRAVVTMASGGKDVVAGAQTQRNVKGGAVKVAVPLRSAARRTLADQGRLALKLTVRVSFGGVAKSASRSVKQLPAA
jgi:hypothetical protein